MTNIYEIYEKKLHHRVIATGTIKEVADKLNVTPTTIRLHYLDRDNDNMYQTCDWKVRIFDEDRQHNSKR